jgi:hypothetical protein
VNIEVQRTTKSLVHPHRTALSGHSSKTAFLYIRWPRGPGTRSPAPGLSVSAAGLRHASCTTAGAETTPLVAERDQMFMMTFGALHPQESLLQPATFEVIGKCLLYVQGVSLPWAAITPQNSG